VTVARQGNTTLVGLGSAHQKDRERALRALAPGSPCPYAYCRHAPMYATVAQAELAGLHPRLWHLDYDHVIARAHGGKGGPCQLAHRYCNRRAGQLLGAKIRVRKRRARTYTRW
jgi:hypothetical protein